MIQLTQTVSLQQKLAPQLIQSLRLLQTPSLELEQLIQQELQINPLLEVSEETSREEEWGLESDQAEADDTDTERKEADDSDPSELEFGDATVADGRFDENQWNEILNDSGYTVPRQEFDPNAEDWEYDGAEQQSLEAELQAQLSLTGLDVGERKIGEYIIGNIDEDGFLQAPVDDIAAMLGEETRTVERILDVIQTFDPPGVGARNLQECLAIQLLEHGLKDSLAMQIVREYWDDLVNRRYVKICRSLGADRAAIANAEGVISGLNPKPMIYREGRINHNLVVPDLEVQKVGDEYVVTLIDRNLPSLRVSPVYRTLLSKSGKPGSQARKFVVDRLNSARWFISAINQRRTTMLKVMRCIVDNQRAFFDKGVGFLKPMVLQDVADRVNMHVSTISRVSNGKYVQTPHGVLELKYFFDGGLARNDGEDIAARSVKQKIARLIAEENTRRPLSDQKITDILKDEGIAIARRTVAKYRDQLKINPARYRKSI
jgi:RNA polymerase sigma-54 factor